MDSEIFGWLISELRLLKNKYKYLESVNATYDPINSCYIVYFNCNFCGDYFTIPVSIADGYVIDIHTIKNIESAFIYYYNAYEKYFT